jgi:hypothetical protein
MKKITTLILLFVFLVSFGQKREYKQAMKLADNKNYTEANVLFEKLLNNEFGSVDNESHFNILLTTANSYEALKDYKTSIDVWKKTIAFLKETHIHENDIDGITNYMEKLKLKIPQEPSKIIEVLKKVESKPIIESVIPDNKNEREENSKVNNIITPIEESTNISVIKNDNIEVNSDKTVKLTVSGTGKTLEEAKLNAMRSAVEQAFGAFISSKTEILNDNLISDQITSVANGNIQSFEILNESQLPNGSYATSLKVFVSIDKLTNFVEAKGVKVEIKGGLFALNIKQQLLNEQGETKAICDLVGVLHEVMQTSFNYSIKSDLPKSLDSESKNWEIPLVVTATCNKNIDFCANYFIKTLKTLALSEEEVKSYKSLNKSVYKIDVFYKDAQYVFYFRRQSSFNILKTYNSLWTYYTRLFTVKSGLDLVQGLEITKSRKLNGSIYNLMNNSMFKLVTPISDNWPNPIDSYYREQLRENSLSFYFLNEENVAAIYLWSDHKTLNQIENLDGYVVNPKGVHSDIKNGGIIVNEKNGHGLMIALYDLEPLNFIDANVKSKDFLLYGYKNWRLPSIDECNIIYHNLSQFRIGGFRNAWYLTNNKVYDYGFDWGNEDNAYSQALLVRLVRSF